jgi:hypothetical protein
MPIFFGGVGSGEVRQNVLAQKYNIQTPGLVATERKDDLGALRQLKANAIDAYFEARNMPMHGTGLKMVEEAEKNNLDWRLLPAIAVRESTGGKNACNRASYNAFGWGSCRIGFKSNEEAIKTVALNLGGNNPKTERHYRGDKTVIELLQAYNPPSIVPNYAKQVISIMNTIGDENPIIPFDA